MRTIEKTVYQFSELSDDAKENAREWYRGWLDELDYSCVIDDAVNMASIIGITVDVRAWRNTNGFTGKTPKIYFSGFSSQGDGASFEGDYRYKKGAAAAVAYESGNDATLINIAKRLQEIQHRNFYSLRANVSTSGRYCHEYAMRADVFDRFGESANDDISEEILDEMRDFARWIYKRLEQEYEYINSDETIEESILHNEYEFFENGEIAC